MIRFCWLVLMALQFIWHALLPAPMGNSNWMIAVLAVTPLLLPARGIWRGSLRSWTWGGYLSLLYFTIGVMEAWSNPPQRLPALAQVTVVVAFIILITAKSRRSPATGSNA